MRPVSGSSNSSPVHNCLLAALLPADFALMRRHFRPLVLALKQDIERPNRRIEFVCFVKTASVVAVQSETRVEVGLIGREGMSGTAVVLGGRRQWTSGGRPCQIFAREAELPQAAWRAKRDWFQTTKQVAS